MPNASKHVMVSFFGRDIYDDGNDIVAERYDVVINVMNDEEYWCVDYYVEENGELVWKRAEDFHDADDAMAYAMEHSGWQ